MKQYGLQLYSVKSHTEADMVVENEPSAEVEMDEARMCIDYLRRLEA